MRALSFVAITLCCMAGMGSLLVQAQDASPVDNSTSSTGAAPNSDESYSEMMRRFFNNVTEGMSVAGALLAVIFILLVVGIIYLYRRNKANEARLTEQNRRMGIALDSTTTPSAAGSNVADLHSIVAGTLEGVATDSKEAGSGAPAPATPKSAAAAAGRGRRGSSPSPHGRKSVSAAAPQVVPPRRPSLNGQKTTVVSTHGARTRSPTPTRAASPAH